MFTVEIKLQLINLLRFNTIELHVLPKQSKSSFQNQRSRPLRSLVVWMYKYYIKILNIIRIIININMNLIRYKIKKNHMKYLENTVSFG